MTARKREKLKRADHISVDDGSQSVNVHVL